MNEKLEGDKEGTGWETGNREALDGEGGGETLGGNLRNCIKGQATGGLTVLSEVRV